MESPDAAFDLKLQSVMLYEHGYKWVWADKICSSADQVTRVAGCSFSSCCRVMFPIQPVRGVLPLIGRQADCLDRKFNQLV